MATYISDGSPSDIQAKVNGASAGDTISVPAGSYTWTAGVTISKSITLSGAGSGSTTITRGAGFNGCLVHITNLASDVPVRVSGFNRSTDYPHGCHHCHDLYPRFIKALLDGKLMFEKDKINLIDNVAGNRLRCSN
jgi:hypothetical protein